MLDLSGIDNVFMFTQIMKRRAFVIRAGILEQQQSISEICRGGLQSGPEGIRIAVRLAFDHQSVAIELSRHTGGKVAFTYGQTEVTASM